MKQQISTKQLNELSEKGKEKLRKWWKPKEGDLYSSDGRQMVHADGLGFAYPDAPNPDHPLLSIGQMIEFLMEHDKHRSFISWDTVFDSQYTGRTWFGKIELDKKKPAIVFRDGYGCGELVDTLWQPVKNILEK